MASHLVLGEQEAIQERILQSIAGVLAHLPNTHLSATVINSPEGPVSNGNGRSSSAQQRKERNPVPEDPSNQPPANEQNNLRLGPRLEENGRLLTARQVADLLAVPESWVREATRDGRLPHLTLGRYRRYQLETIEAWLVDQRAGPAVSPAKRPDLPTPRGTSL